MNTSDLEMDTSAEQGMALRKTRCFFSIHRSAWNINSANFAFWGFSEDEMRRPTPHTQYP